MEQTTESLMASICGGTRTNVNASVAHAHAGVPALPAQSEALADVIEFDARSLMAEGKAVKLERYLGAISGLAEMPAALDTAIEFALRSLVASGATHLEAVQTLIGEHPSLEGAVRECALLNEAVLDTSAVGRSLRHLGSLPLPFEIGPRLADGRPRYELTSEIGSGSTGVVYVGRDRHLSDADAAALVAVKVIYERPEGAGTQGAELDEAIKARRVDHANVVRVLDRGTTSEGLAFVVYELVQGTDLETWFTTRRRSLVPRDAARIVKDVALGVQAAHRAGLLHCDLKPQNILIDSVGVPRVADFGLATRIGANHGEDRAESTTPAGNLAFMAPERFRREPGSLSPASDIYALGALLFYLLTGEYASGATPAAIAATHSASAPRCRTCACLHARRIDRVLSRVCARAMAPLPADRHDSAGELAHDLEAWLLDRPVWSQSPSAFHLCWLWRRRHPVATVFLSAVLLGGSAGGATLAIARADAQQRRREAAAAEARLWSNEAQREEGRRYLASVSHMFRAMRANRLDEEYIGILHWMDTLFGSPFVTAHERDRLLWSERVSSARAIIAEGAASGGTDLRSLMWRTTLGFWLARNGDYAEAEPLLSSCLASWTVMLDPGDPTLAQLSLLRDAAAVNRLLDRPPWQMPAWTEEHESVRARLDCHDGVFTGTLFDSPIHRFVRDSHERLLAQRKTIVDLADSRTPR